jgi:hypothetical protein
MRRYLLAATLLLAFGIPVFSDSVTVMGGYTLPSGDSDVYRQNERETTFRVSDLGGFSGVFAYDHFLGNHFNLGGDVSVYEQNTNVQDVEFSFLDGTPIFRNIRLEIVPLEASLHFLPAGRDVPVIPYIGGGGGVYFWEYQEVGDFVQDRNTDPSIITGAAHSDGADPGWHVEGGIQIPFSRYATFTAEAKYFSASGKLDVRSFDPNFGRLDLSAAMYSAGISFWF